jgi:putative transposase
MTKSRAERLLDELLSECVRPEDIFGKHGLIDRLHARALELCSADVPAVAQAEIEADAQAWQSRPLESLYPIVYFDALPVKTRQAGPLGNRTAYLALAINVLGQKELLGLWIGDNANEGEGGVQFWSAVLTQLQSRGMRDCLIASVEGLPGFEQALQAVFPRTRAQLCILHKLRNSLRYVLVKHRRAVAIDLRAIYASPTLSAAQAALHRFGERWDERYPLISCSWRRDWPLLTAFFDYPPAIRKVVYTTNAVESLNYSLQRLLRSSDAFANDDVAFRVLYMAAQRSVKTWTMPLHNWGAALNRLAVMFPDRIVV